MTQTDTKRKNDRDRSKRKTRCQGLVKSLATAYGLKWTGKDLSGVDQLLDLFESGKIEIEIIEVK